MSKKRILICTFIALMSGLSGTYIGTQINMSLQQQKCQSQPWGINTLCKTWVTPGAIWQGSTTGLWMGTVLGAFVGGLVTRKKSSA
jgi:uncharacterized protein YcfJ